MLGYNTDDQLAVTEASGDRIGKQSRSVLGNTSFRKYRNTGVKKKINVQ